MVSRIDTHLKIREVYDNREFVIKTKQKIRTLNQNINYVVITDFSGKISNQFMIDKLLNLQF